MAGGGQVQVVGGNQRVGDGIASVIDRALCVHVANTPNTIPVAARQITDLFTQTFDNITADLNSPAVAVGSFRYGIVHLKMTRVLVATDIRFILQQSPDGGTTWTDLAVDQWVDLRYIPGQMPLNESIPLNYPIGTTVRLRAIAVGTTAANTITVQAWLELIT